MHEAYLCKRKNQKRRERKRKKEKYTRTSSCFYDDVHSIRSDVCNDTQVSTAKSHTKFISKILRKLHNFNYSRLLNVRGTMYQIFFFSFHLYTLEAINHVKNSMKHCTFIGDFYMFRKDMYIFIIWNVYSFSNRFIFLSYIYINI